MASCRFDKLVIAFLAIVATVVPPLSAQQASATAIVGNETDAPIPKPKTRYLGRTIAPTMSFEGAWWLIRGTRDQEENPEAMVEQLKLKPGMTVCDLGCGNGFHTIPMSKIVGKDGKVYAVDVQPEMLEMLSRRIDEERIENIELLLGSVIDPKLPEGELDLVLMVDVYHEFSHPDLMLSRIRKSLKPDGVVALVEFRGEDPTVPILPLHKMTKKQIHREYNANGFKLRSEFDGLPIQHLMFFEIDDTWTSEEDGASVKK